MSNGERDEARRAAGEAQPAIVQPETVHGVIRNETDAIVAPVITLLPSLGGFVVGHVHGGAQKAAHPIFKSRAPFHYRYEYGPEFKLALEAALEQVAAVASLLPGESGAAIFGPEVPALHAAVEYVDRLRRQRDELVRYVEELDRLRRQRDELVRYVEELERLGSHGDVSRDFLDVVDEARAFLRDVRAEDAARCELSGATEEP